MIESNLKAVTVWLLAHSAWRGDIVACFLSVALSSAIIGAEICTAHEVRPAYLAIKEDALGQFSVLWKTPMQGDLRLALSPKFSGRTENITQITTRRTGEAAVQTWRMKAIDSVRGQSVRIVGLESTMTDALLRFEFLDGATWTHRLTPQRPSVFIPAQQTWVSVAGVYLKLGVEHISFGLDHLLFVFGLMLLVCSRSMLVKTITSFTIAHSITLAIATLGYASAPLAPLSASIALSILFLGPEILRKERGDSSLTIRHPWIVAFCFGLLHGFGFSSALTNTGLPRVDLILALLAFNVGVEVGQLAFVLVVILIQRAIRQLEVIWPIWMARVPGYAVGTLGAFWAIQRTVMLR